LRAINSHGLARLVIDLRLIVKKTAVLAALGPLAICGFLLNRLRTDQYS
jgi:hypothetical protein